ncbi:MAG: DUF4876 domain-containing protein [Gemmatimonadota bacterium]|nr:MAG: DUF4876 domain-containing protein [Gemmatimonadota bacterium]
MLALAAVPRVARRARQPLPTRLRAGLLLCCLPFLSMACEHATTLIDPLAGDSIPGDGTVQRAALTITITVTGADSVLASAVGSAGGVLGDAEVTLERSGSTEGPRSAVTDAAGTVRFEDLLPGTYAVSALRVLTVEEVARFGSEDADVNAFGGGEYVTVEAPSTEAVVSALAGRRGSLVISEHFGSMPSLSESGGWPSYDYGHFLELYNNSDTTIYLDGKVIVLGFTGLLFDLPDQPCTISEKWRTDPEGIRARFFEAFPGSGRDYALAPGEAVVVATDAVDHRQFHPELHDLSRADFEFIGSSDVDNPGVPNMVNIGLYEFAADYYGHGLMLRSVGGIVILVAEPLVVSGLPVDYIPASTRPEIRRIPGAKVLDVFSSIFTPERQAGSSLRHCGQNVHESFDRQGARLLDYELLHSEQRRVHGMLPDGRVILQRTKTSSRDFHARRQATPGRVP